MVIADKKKPFRRGCFLTKISVSAGAQGLPRRGRSPRPSFGPRPRRGRRPGKIILTPPPAGPPPWQNILTAPPAGPPPRLQIYYPAPGGAAAPAKRSDPAPGGGVAPAAPAYVFLGLEGFLCLFFVFFTGLFTLTFKGTFHFFLGQKFSK